MVIFPIASTQKGARPTRQEFIRIGRHLLPGWRPFLLLLFCILAGTVFNLAPPLMIRTIIDRALPQKDALELYLCVAVIIIAALTGGLVGVWRNHIATALGQNVIFDLRCRLYERLLHQSLSFFTQTRTGEILSRIQNDVGGVQNVVNGTLVIAFANIVLVVCTILVIFYIDWRLALVASAVLPLYILPTRKVAHSRGKISKETQESLADLSSFLQETLSVGGFLLVRLFGAERYEITRLSKKAAAVRDLQIRESVIGRWLLMWVLLFVTVGPALIYLVGGQEVIDRKVTIGTVVAFVSFLGQLYLPACMLVNTHMEIIAAVSLFRRIFEYLDLPCGIEEPIQAAALDRPVGRLQFENVTMIYGPGRAALTDISFEACPGQMVALVGPSGAGKTTVTYLASRLYDPTSGSVAFDGVDLRKLRLADISRWIAKVTQEVTLFNATVEENLRYAKPDASSGELERACSLAQIHEVIAALPHGYSTLLGERGYKLSGGERQRIAIARVLLRDPRLLILDEATSSLDSRSEELIQTALESVLRGRTSIVVAHRLSTVLRADLILVIDGGRVVERGTHAELLGQRGLYKKLYTTQFRTTTITAA
jgi:ATP-binding cassette subfamily B protein